jgi:hypothetical protein
MSTATTEFLLRVNGIQPAFGIEFGLESPRADEGRAGDPYRQANVSCSLVQWWDGPVERHTLIRPAEHGMILGDTVPWPE